ncbi:MAG: PEGA domain-containing protein [Planctomycetes bacterium]|nr:PEGA domain-containing protein [Planctomycetota bacterium]
MLRRRLLPLLALTFACLPSCTAWLEKKDVLITSEPLGARILVDGEDTGHTTPHVLPIGGNFGRDHVVRLEKRGYRPAHRRLYQHTEGYTSKWIDGAYEVVMFPLPFFWTTGDFLLPFGIRGALLPRELFVRLQRTEEPLLGFDLLAARREQQGASR